LVFRTRPRGARLTSERRASKNERHEPLLDPDFFQRRVVDIDFGRIVARLRRTTLAAAITLCSTHELHHIYEARTRRNRDLNALLGNHLAIGDYIERAGEDLCLLFAGRGPRERDFELQNALLASVERTVATCWRNRCHERRNGSRGNQLDVVDSAHGAR